MTGRTPAIASARAHKKGVDAAKEEIAKEGYTTIQLCQSIGSFADDPPDSAFQKGYLQGLFDELQERLAQ